MIQNIQDAVSRDIKVVRPGHLADNIVIADGLPGCGKTMLSPIIASLDRVELLTYAYQLENICAMHYLGKIAGDGAAVLVRMWTDLQLYNTMMARELNFRFSDLSSVFRNRPMRYIKRLFQKGDEAVVSRIKRERPILQLTTHHLLAISEPILRGLGERVVFIDIVRHPLYMIKQQTLNMERVIATPRHFAVYFKYGDREVPYYTTGWEDLFLKSSPIDRAIYNMEHILSLIKKNKDSLVSQYHSAVITVPFEKFVITPWPYIEEIAKALGTKATSYTYKVMKKQNVPRKMYAEGVGLGIYKRCGWEPPRSSSEKEELKLRRRYAAERASTTAMAVLDRLCSEYENTYNIDVG